MGNYLARRLLLTFVLLIGISLISFGIIQLAPGDPALLLAGPNRTPQEVETIRVNLGLTDPLPVQYVKTIQALLTGNLQSFTSRRNVMDLIGERLPTTLIVGGLALAFGVSVGIAIGLAQALRPYSRLDDLGTIVSLFGFSVPNFWLAQMLILIFAVTLGWLPASGIRPVSATGWNPFEMAPYLVLPVVVLATGFMASVARFTRSGVLESLGEDYVRTARAKGLPERRVLSHALRNSLLPIITLLGLFLPFMIGGSVVIESILALPGIGRLALDSVVARDYPVIMTINLMGAVAVLLGNLLADLAYAIADPRIRYR